MVIKILITIVFIIFGVILYVNFFGQMDSNILNKNWYRYDPKTGYYEVLNIKDDKLIYYYPESKKESEKYEKCSSYRYNKKQKYLILNCLKKMEIKYSNKETLVLMVDDVEKQFYLDIDSSFNKEFSNFYRKSLSEFKRENSYILDLNRSSITKMKEEIKEQSPTVAVMSGDMCNNIECDLFLLSLEKWIVDSDRVFYIDTTNISEEEINYFNTLNSKLGTYKDYYNNSYPRILIFNNNELINQTLIKCNGLDCSKYDKYLKDKQVFNNNH